MKIEHLITEHKKGVKAVKYTSKPRDPNTKTMQGIRSSGAAGAHKDKKKAMKQGDVKHKGKELAENSERDMLPGTMGSVEEDWNKVNHHDKTDGLSKKAVKAYRREHPGSKLQTAVTTEPSKLKKGSKSAKRRASFCARMSGMKKAHASAKTKRDPDSPINKALRRWHCESIEDMRNMIIEGEQMISELKKGQKDSNGFTKCWPGKHAEGTKKGKNGGQVRNCVPNEDISDTIKGAVNKVGDALSTALPQDMRPFDNQTAASNSKQQKQVKETSRNPDMMSQGDYDRYQQGQMDYQKRDFKRREMEHELGDEDRGMYFVVIAKNGKWEYTKAQPRQEGMNAAQNIINSLHAKYPSMHLGMMGPDGKVYNMGKGR